MRLPPIVLLLAALLHSLRRVLNDCARGLNKPELGLTAEVASWVPLLFGFLIFGHSGTSVAWTLVISATTGLVTIGLLLVVARDEQPVLPTVQRTA